MENEDCVEEEAVPRPETRTSMALSWETSCERWGPSDTSPKPNSLLDPLLKPRSSRMRVSTGESGPLLAPRVIVLGMAPRWVLALESAFFTEPPCSRSSAKVQIASCLCRTGGLSATSVYKASIKNKQEFDGFNKLYHLSAAGNTLDGAEVFVSIRISTFFVFVGRSAPLFFACHD